VLHIAGGLVRTPGNGRSRTPKGRSGKVNYPKMTAGQWKGEFVGGCRKKGGNGREPPWKGFKTKKKNSCWIAEIAFVLFTQGE